MEYEALPYDVLIDPYGVHYGPAGTPPLSRDWQTWPDVASFFSIVCNPTFVLNVVTWRVRGSEVR